jgi:hypothetical protein
VRAEHARACRRASHGSLCLRGLAAIAWEPERATRTDESSGAVATPAKAINWRGPDGTSRTSPRILDLGGINSPIVAGLMARYRPIREERVRDQRTSALKVRAACLFRRSRRAQKAGGRELGRRTWDELANV